MPLPGAVQAQGLVPGAVQGLVPGAVQGLVPGAVQGLVQALALASPPGGTE
ncbi:MULTISPECIES: hypothetical protein [Corynebacterium]|uniref:hypothetical protein n=1 Tax=Corynebacterium TaxID=1716 RepID=UPI001F17C788|nr:MULTISPECIES: hypothetical protein [Corynebacterium]